MPKKKETTYFGKPIHKMNRKELIAAIIQISRDANSSDIRYFDLKKKLISS